MTIDDMLDEVARITGTAPEKKNENNEKKSFPFAAATAHEAPAPLVSRSGIGLALAKELAYCVEQAASAMSVNVVVAIVNEGGRLVLTEAMDSSYIASVDAARDKAYTAAALRMPTHEALKEARGGTLDGLTNGNGILLLGGGYPLTYNGAVIGGIGVSGGTKEQDMTLARAGVMYFEKRVNKGGWSNGR